ncbi:hypothetical protein K1719_030734 [Acacia pycnantha]|nr:hypothetical protein K1719_030734 [Acacia pycnantha]
MACSRVLFTEVPPTTVVSFLGCDARSINWSICVKGYVALAILRKRDMIRRLSGVLTTGFCFILRKFCVERGPNLINLNMKIVLESFTEVELVRDIIVTPDTVFQPLLSFAATTFTESTLISNTFSFVNLLHVFCILGITSNSFADVVGQVTSVYGMADIVVHGENENQFNFEIMDKRGSAAFWALDSYSRVRNKDDVVVELLWVEMKRLSDGDILFSSHCDLSKAHFNYHHRAVIDFRSKLNHAVASQEDDSSDSTTSKQDRYEASFPGRRSFHFFKGSS